MPIFEYHCPDCNEDFEELRSPAQRDKEAPCPKCGSLRPQRKISLFASQWESRGGISACVPRGGFT